MSYSPSMTTVRHPVPAATYADIEALPPGVNGEILAGELVVSPRPAAPHALAASMLGALLVTPFRLGVGGPGGWWIIDEPELSLAGDPLYDPVISDLAGWRMQTLPEHPDTAQYHVAPDWVCEVVSPSTVRRDRVLKVPFYARAGVRHTWLVDPVAQTLEVFEFGSAEGTYILRLTAAGDERVHAPPFEAVELDLSHLWARHPL